MPGIINSLCFPHKRFNCIAILWFAHQDHLKRNFQSQILLFKLISPNHQAFTIQTHNFSDSVFHSDDNRRLSSVFCHVKLQSLFNSRVVHMELSYRLLFKLSGIRYPSTSIYWIRIPTKHTRLNDSITPIPPTSSIRQPII